MTFTRVQNFKASQAETSEPAAYKQQASLRSWLLSWEIYLIVLVASFLRLYGIQRTEFDGDQADIFQMAHDAIVRGHLVATSNIASIGIYNPPGTIYFLMVPAAISADPVGGAIFTAILSIASVLLTYFCMRRYFGRLAATISASLYATAALSIFYSRFMWNQNLLFFFVTVLIFLFLEVIFFQRKGWLILAIPLLGLLFQLHGSGILLLAPLIVTVVLAPKTVRIRDIVFGSGLLLLLYLPYILWEFSVSFHDVSVLLTGSQRENVYDNQIWILYQTYLSPFYESFLNLDTVYITFFKWVRVFMTGLIILSLLFALFSGLKALRRQHESPRVWWLKPLQWVKALQSSPEGCALLVLASWQLVMLSEIHHTIKLQLHYLIVFAPGQYLLVGIFLAWLIYWLRQRTGWPRVAMYSLSIFSLLLILVQLVGSTYSVLDAVTGQFNEKDFSHPYYNDLQSMQDALARAEDEARVHRIQHIYVDADRSNFSGFRYLAGQAQIPTIVSNDECVLLPDASRGPIIWLVSPYSAVNEALVTHLTNATLLSVSHRPSGAPFKLYLVQPPVHVGDQPLQLSNGMQYLGSQSIHTAQAQGLLTQWRLEKDRPATTGQFYNYHVTSNELGRDSCKVTSVQSDDQLWTFFPQQPAKFNQLSLRVEMYQSTEQSFSLPGLLSFITFDTFSYQTQRFQKASANQGSLTIPWP
ncbi:ArnT family glycosyltransferase [Tengunoibacter tsumagoiensis]|uniref:Glycosyltransferase RgtA/B/C/D-like domain-containing protein n=1 Tax=Tengunoibacter tsumagoiensis TaxID=2014871 RepID=A0A402A226_9CHLR|nr:glycosyltransferase family 39 protein [Tengunoibacter tsumagoiensis]GCE13203.1 hypothetical protein KTT_30620 [Tengunoibacter tsumagoiensis]